MGPPATAEKHARVRSMRSRWNRAFLLLTIIVVLNGVAGFIGTRLLVDRFRSSAVGVEREATVSAQLRTDLVRHAVVISSPATATQQRLVQVEQSEIRTRFATAIANEKTAPAQRLLSRSRARWEKIVSAAGAVGHPTALPVRGAAVSAGAPDVLALLDQAGLTSRAAVRQELGQATRIEREAMAVLAVLELLAILLAIRLIRRLSSEILRPVGALRDAAHHLAAGRLDHRVVVHRADELGELARSFNTMADAIADSQRSLTLEATTDSLSGLANRVAFRTRLETTLVIPERAAAARQCFSSTWTTSRT